MNVSPGVPKKKVEAEARAGLEARVAAANLAKEEACASISKTKRKEEDALELLRQAIFDRDEALFELEQQKCVVEQLQNAATETTTAAAAASVSLNEVVSSRDITTSKLEEEQRKSCEALRSANEADMRAAQLEERAKESLVAFIELQTCVNEEKRARKEATQELAAVREALQCAQGSQSKEDQNIESELLLLGQRACEAEAVSVAITIKLTESECQRQVTDTELAAVRDTEQLLKSSNLELSHQIGHATTLAEQQQHALTEMHLAFAQLQQQSACTHRQVWASLAVLQQDLGGFSGEFDSFADVHRFTADAVAKHVAAARDIQTDMSEEMAILKQANNHLSGIQQRAAAAEMHASDELEKLAVLLDSVESTVNSSTAAAVGTIRSATEKMGAVAAEMSDLETASQRVKGEHALLQARVDSTGEALFRMCEERNDAEIQLANTLAECDSTQREIRTLWESVSSALAGSQIDHNLASLSSRSMRMDLDDITRMLARMDSDKSALKADVEKTSNMASDLTDTRKQLETVQNLLDRVRAEALETSRDMKGTSALAEKLATDKEVLQMDVMRITEDIQASAKQCDRLEDELGKMRLVAAELRDCQASAVHAEHTQTQWAAEINMLTLDLDAIRGSLHEVVAGLEGDRQSSTQLLECNATTCAGVIDMLGALHDTQVELSEILEWATLALEDEAECRLAFELGKGVCDEVEATLDSLQDSVRRVKCEARLRKETAQLLEDEEDTTATQLTELHQRVPELEEQLQRTLAEQSQARASFDSQISKLEDELEEAAELLQATCTTEDRLRAELAGAKQHLQAARARGDVLQTDLNKAMATLKSIDDEQDARDNVAICSNNTIMPLQSTVAQINHVDNADGSETRTIIQADAVDPSSIRIRLSDMRVETDTVDDVGSMTNTHIKDAALQLPCNTQSVDVSVRETKDMTSLQQKVVVQHVRILELEDHIHQMRVQHPSSPARVSNGSVTHAAPRRQDVYIDIACQDTSLSFHDVEGRDSHPCAGEEECEHEEVLEEARAELVRICASQQGQDGLGWDEDDGSDEVLDLLQVLQRALRLKHLQVEFLTESLVNSPSSGEVGTLTAKNAIITAQLAAALDRLSRFEQTFGSSPSRADRGRDLKTDDSIRRSSTQAQDTRRCEMVVQCRVGEMAELLATKENEVEALQMKLMTQSELLQVMSEDKQSTAQRLQKWLFKIANNGGAEWEQWGMHHRHGVVDAEDQAGNRVDIQVRDAVGIVLLEREALLRNVNDKNDKVVAMERQHMSLQSRLTALKEASIEALEHRDATIHALRSTLRDAREASDGP